MATETLTPQEDTRDLGFGSKVTQQLNTRFLNRDGSFNVKRSGLPFLRSLNLYHSFLTMSWARFYTMVALFYFSVNILFALGYLLTGDGGLSDPFASTFHEKFFDAFFFSVQTLGTIGYGRISPVSFSANLLVTAESLVGLLGIALATGILFARFSRPQAKILFSDTAVIAPYRGINALEFRIANARTNQLIDVEATVLLSRMETHNGVRTRKFYELPLERKKVTFMPLHWVIVHPIVESSPMYTVSREEFEAADSEVLILLTATDETFFQTVHARSSYKHQEITWGAKFASMFTEPSGALTVDLRQLSRLETVEQSGRFS
ncbi:MAG: ion channel [Bacteroidota bacterium]